MQNLKKTTIRKSIENVEVSSFTPIYAAPAIFADMGETKMDFVALIKHSGNWYEHFCELPEIQKNEFRLLGEPHSEDANYNVLLYLLEQLQNEPQPDAETAATFLDTFIDSASMPILRDDLHRMYLAYMSHKAGAAQEEELKSYLKLQAMIKKVLPLQVFLKEKIHI